MVVLLLVVALFAPKKFSIERQVVINQPSEKVFAYVRHLKNQDHFNKWVMADPGMKTEFRGQDGTVGYVYAWEGNDDVGQGEQEIIKLQEGKLVEMEIRFKKPMESVAQAPMQTISLSGDQTQVTWGMQGANPYPLNLMHWVMDPMLGPDLEESLGNLKAILEKQDSTQFN